MYRFVRTLLVGSAFFWFSFYGAVMGYVLMPIVSLGAKDRHEKLRRTHDFLQRRMRSFIGYMRWCGLLDVEVEELPEVLQRGDPCVVIANHPSLLDVIMIAASVPNTVFLVKESWFRSPFIGPLLRRGAHIPGPSQGEEASLREGAWVVDRMVERLTEGYSVIIFPEGTRSPRHDLGVFKRGAFDAAIRAQVPLVSLLMRVDPPALLKGDQWYVYPEERVQFSLRLLDMHQPDGTQSARSLRKKTQQRYREALGLTPPPRSRSMSRSKAPAPPVVPA